MGHASGTVRTHTQHVTTFNDDTIGVSICIPLGSTWLQCKSFCTTGVQGRNPRHTRIMWDMGATHCQRLPCGQRLGALQVPWSLYPQYQKHPHMLWQFLSSISIWRCQLLLQLTHHLRGRLSQRSHSRKYIHNQHHSRCSRPAHGHPQVTSQDSAQCCKSSKGAQETSPSWEGDLGGRPGKNHAGTPSETCCIFPHIWSWGAQGH